MHRGYSIFGLALAGVCAGIAAGVAGLSTWLAAPVESEHTLTAVELPPANAVQQDFAPEAWRAYAVRYGFVEVGALPEDHTVPINFIESILPPSEAASFRPTASDSQSSRREQGQAIVQNHRIAVDPYRVLNDAQIASIKVRLKLTRDQEGMWPPVETALRKISYKKPSKGGDGNGSIDFDSPEVQQLISAAQRLIVRLSETQKREIRSLAHVMGLDSVASLF